MLLFYFCFPLLSRVLKLMCIIDMSALLTLPKYSVLDRINCYLFMSLWPSSLRRWLRPFLRVFTQESGVRAQSRRTSTDQTRCRQMLWAWAVAPLTCSVWLTQPATWVAGSKLVASSFMGSNGKRQRRGDEHTTNTIHGYRKMTRIKTCHCHVTIGVYRITFTFLKNVWWNWCHSHIFQRFCTHKLLLLLELFFSFINNLFASLKLLSCIEIASSAAFSIAGLQQWRYEQYFYLSKPCCQLPNQTIRKMQSSPNNTRSILIFFGRLLVIGHMHMLEVVLPCLLLMMLHHFKQNKKSPQAVGLRPPMCWANFLAANFNANPLNILIHS